MNMEFTPYERAVMVALGKTNLPVSGDALAVVLSGHRVEPFESRGASVIARGLITRGLVTVAAGGQANRYLLTDKGRERARSVLEAPDG